MFEQLFGSKTRVKLLSLFLSNPGRSYYVREITRKIDEQINSVRRELSNLLSIGIVKSEGSNNRLYYEVDPNYQHYKELRGIFTKIPIKTRESKVIAETKEEDQITKKLLTTGRIDTAFLSGYFVHDNQSGVDICIVGDVNRAKVSKVIGELEKDMGRELNYTVMTPDDYNYRLNLNDRFLTKVVEAKKIMLIDSSKKGLKHTEIMVEETEAEVVEVDENAPHKIGISDFAERIPVRVKKITH